jgi:hypothetical protein
VYALNNTGIILDCLKDSLSFFKVDHILQVADRIINGLNEPSLGLEGKI